MAQSSWPMKKELQRVLSPAGEQFFFFSMKKKTFSNIFFKKNSNNKTIACTIKAMRATNRRMRLGVSVAAAVARVLVF